MTFTERYEVEAGALAVAKAIQEHLDPRLRCEIRSSFSVEAHIFEGLLDAYRVVIYDSTGEWAWINLIEREGEARTELWLEEPQPFVSDVLDRLPFALRPKPLTEEEIKARKEERIPSLLRALWGKVSVDELREAFPEHEHIIDSLLDELGVVSPPPSGRPRLPRWELIDRLVKALEAEEMRRAHPQTTWREIAQDIGWPRGCGAAGVKLLEDARKRLARLRKADPEGELAEAERLWKEKRKTP